MKFAILAAAFVMGTTSVAVSAQEAQPAAPKEKKICRSERMTGSLTRSTRICLTEAQWREVNARTKKGVDEMQGNASGSQAVVNNPGPAGM